MTTWPIRSSSIGRIGPMQPNTTDERSAGFIRRTVRWGSAGHFHLPRHYHVPHQPQAPRAPQISRRWTWPVGDWRRLRQLRCPGDDRIHWHLGIHSLEHCQGARLQAWKKRSVEGLLLCHRWFHFPLAFWAMRRAFLAAKQHSLERFGSNPYLERVGQSHGRLQKYRWPRARRLTLLWLWVTLAFSTPCSAFSPVAARTLVWRPRTDWLPCSDWSAPPAEWTGWFCSGAICTARQTPPAFLRQGPSGKMTPWTTVTWKTTSPQCLARSVLHDRLRMCDRLCEAFGLDTWKVQASCLTRMINAEAGRARKLLWVSVFGLRRVLEALLLLLFSVQAGLACKTACV